MMNVLRVTLFLGAALTLLYILRQIRKSRLQIDYAISWALFAAALVLMSLFPRAVLWVAAAFRFESPANMVYVLIIFVLLLKQFSMTMKLSELNHKLEQLAQHIALQENKDAAAKKETER